MKIYKFIFILFLTIATTMSFAAEQVHWMETEIDSVTLEWHSTAASDAIIHYGIPGLYDTEEAAIHPSPLLSSSSSFREAKIIALAEIKGENAQQRVIQWKKLIKTTKDLPDQEKIQRVNEFFNKNIAFVDDIKHWGVEDYWATPIESLATGAGDCEDYAIAKYFTLEQLGIDTDKMRITYEKAYKLNQAHMVLTYSATPDAVPVVLDNLTSTIEPATKRTDLLPIYSFNDSTLWLAETSGSSKRVGGSEQLSLWTDLKQRMLNNPQL